MTKYKYKAREYRNPVVYVTPEVKAKLDTYIGLCKYEISGLGTVEQIGKDFLVTDLFLLEQKVDSASTELDPAAIAKLMTEMMATGAPVDKLKVWFHSHVNMSAYWSSTDDDTIDGFDNDYFISIVGNKSGEYRVRLDVYTPLRLTIDELELQVQHSVSEDFVKGIKTEIESKVTYAPTVYKRQVWVQAKEVDGKWIPAHLEDVDDDDDLLARLGYDADDWYADEDEEELDALARYYKTAAGRSRKKADVIPINSTTEEEYRKLPCNGCKNDYRCHDCAVAKRMAEGAEA